MAESEPDPRVQGDKITYAYDVAEQAVGSNGQRYTKASYVSTIVDTFGRTVTFVYGDKIYDRARVSAISGPA